MSGIGMFRIRANFMRALKTKLYAYISQKYMDGCSNYNSLAVRRSCRSKEQARDKFAANDLPHARGEIFLSPWRALNFAKEHGYPLVIKPNVSGFSRGSHFPIEDAKSLLKAAFMVKVWWPFSVVEQYLLGANYRVLATQDGLVSVIRRYPPFIDGDGQNTISDLIDTENATREQMGLFPVIYPIKKSPQVVKYLKKQGRDLSTVPNKDERVYLFNRVALAPGGIVETINQDTIPAENVEMFKRVVKIFDANVLGIDVILEDGIEKSYKSQRSILLEVNSRPYMKMHDVPRYGKLDDLTDFYATMEKLEVADADTF